MKKAAETEGRRKTLVDRQNETQIADPAAHAKKQVSELDKTAKRSLDKRKKCTENIEKDKKELAHIESQINRINTKYVQLCSSLQEARDKRDYLLQVLDTCVCDEKQVCSQIIFSIHDALPLFIINLNGTSLDYGQNQNNSTRPKNGRLKIDAENGYNGIANVAWI